MKPDDVIDADEVWDEKAFASLAEAEERHFWFRGRNRILGGLFQRLTSDLPDGYRVLEVGCGTGNVLRELERVCRRGHVAGLDLYEDGLRHARRRVSCPLIHGDVRELPPGPGYDIVGAFDVIEHVADDVSVLRGIASALNQGGRVIVTVPAYQTLWSHTDVVAGHFRRYTPKSLRTALESAGLAVEYVTPFMAPLFPLMWAGRRLASFFGGAGRDDVAQSRELALREFRINPLLNRGLEWLLRFDAATVARMGQVPTGTSILAVARARSAAPIAKRLAA